MARKPVDAKLSLERRRKRNREAMQRLRERQQHAVDELHATAGKLAATYNELLMQVDLSAAIVERPLPSLRLEEAKQHAQTLIQENARLQATIDECVKREDRFALLLDDLRPINFLEPTPFLEFEFVTPPRLNTALAAEFIRLHRERHIVYEKQWLAVDRSPYSSQFLGWEIQYFFQGEYLYVKFSKVLRQVTPLQVSQRAWGHALKMMTYRLAASSLRMVQRVHDDAFVYAGWARGGDAKRATYHMRFRVNEPDGAIGIGTQTLPQPQQYHAPRGETRWGSELSLFVKLTPYRDADGSEEHCMAELSGRVTYGDVENAHRNALEMVISLARWEEANVNGSPMQLVW